jgi:hypothetical protein
MASRTEPSRNKRHFSLAEIHSQQQISGSSSYVTYRQTALSPAFLASPMNFDPEYNHGFTEAAALALVAANRPSLPEAPSWQATALDRLSSLMVNFVDVDGVELENSPFYHFYVLSLAYQIDRWSRRYGILCPRASRLRWIA